MPKLASIRSPRARTLDAIPSRSRLIRALGVEPARLRQHHGELVPADPVRLVAASQLAAQRVGEQLQRLVARVVAARVVDGLEVVQVAEQQREAGSPFDLAHQPGAERAPVGQPGERVVGRLVTQARRLLGGVDRRHRLVREQPQRLQRAVVGSSRSRGSSTQITPIRRSPSTSGTISQCRDQACGPRPLSSER